MFRTADRVLMLQLPYVRLILRLQGTGTQVEGIANETMQGFETLKGVAAYAYA